MLNKCEIYKILMVKSLLSVLLNSGLLILRAFYCETKEEQNKKLSHN